MYPLFSRITAFFIIQFICLLPFRFASGQDRKISVTFDDLPLTAINGCGDEKARTINRNLLAAITEHNVPAIGFVNENKLYTGGYLNKNREALLFMWLKAGLELGNHTFSHPDLNTTDIDEYTGDIIRGEKVTKSLLAEYDKQLVYFRHPMLHAGNTREKKARLEQFLEENGYTAAPVTMDNSEWIFAHAYRLSKKPSVREEIRDSYCTYMNEVFAYYERYSQSLFGRSIPQTLLLHANELNADAFGRLAAILAARGYSFVPLVEALRDEAYNTPDTYTGSRGLSWLHRWALSIGKRGLSEEPEPAVPEFIMQLSGL